MNGLHRGGFVSAAKQHHSQQIKGKKNTYERPQPQPRRFRQRNRTEASQHKKGENAGGPWLTVEGRVTPEKDVGDDADAPHVHRCAVWRGLEDLRRDIYKGEDTSRSRNMATNNIITTPSHISPLAQQRVRITGWPGPWLSVPYAVGKDALALHTTPTRWSRVARG